MSDADNTLDIEAIRKSKIVITGAAGLVGQNLMLLLREQGYTDLVAIDKHAENLAILAELNPDVLTHHADLSEPGDWQQLFEGVNCVVILQAHITGLDWSEFERHNITANQLIQDTCKQYNVPYIVQASSSVVVSSQNDFYVQSKTAQEEMAMNCGIPCVALRPTLMFGWFDPKHLGWLARFMEKTPVYPIPGHGRYVRQPLYNRDFCRILQYCIEHRPEGKVYDIVGNEEIDYIDIIRMIKRIKKLNTIILCIPKKLFEWLMRGYAMISSKPPFTVSQLEALTNGDYFTGVDTEKEFGIKLTPIEEAFTETFTDERYSHILIKR
jgi:nucleoside-diphosphate-sugar epimerase